MNRSFNSVLTATLIALSLGVSSNPTTAAVTPGGTFADKAIIIEAVGGEQLTRATAAGAFGPVLVHDFDTSIALDGSYEIVSATEIALSAGRHVVMYDTRFNANAGGNRAEIQTNVTLAGVPLAAGRSQGYIRRTGNHDDAVMSGGAIITVAADDDLMTLESRRSDTNTNASVLPTRVPNGTAVQLLKINDSWDYLSASLAANQPGNVGTTAVDVTYDTLDATSSLGSAFTFSAPSGGITLNETGLYLVFANTSIEKPTNNTRTNYQQWLALNGAEVTGSKTTSYLRGNEDTNEGMTALGMVLAATAGDLLNVKLVMESGGSAGIIQGGETALSIVKLPPTAKYISLLDTTNQEVNDVALDPVVFNTLLSPSNAEFNHTSGGSAVTVSAADDYLFFGSVYTESDTANDNHDRMLPLHGWQIDGAGGQIFRGRGAQYNRDNGGNRTSGSWGAAILPLTGSQTVELTTQGIANLDQGADSITALQALSISSLVVSNDPAISVNLPLTMLPSDTATITNAFLETFDNDTPPTGLTYTVDSVPAGGDLRHTTAGSIGLDGTFTQDDIDNNRIVFDSIATNTVGGFDFTVSDGGASDSSSFVINVEWPTTTVTISDDGDATEGSVIDFIVTADVAPVGADMTVTFTYSGSATDGSDFTGVASVDILDGQTLALINVNTLADGLFEGAESVTCTIDSVSGPTVTGNIGSPSSSTALIFDGPNSAPTATNLPQVAVGTGNVPLADILVTDPDKGADSSVTGTAGDPLFHTNGITDLTNYSDGRPDDDSSHDLDATGPALNAAAGFSLELRFIPQAADLIGTVQIWEIGGSSNGSSIHLVNGVPHLLSKAGGNAGNAPTDDTTVPGAFNDLDWAGDNTVVVPLGGAPALVAGVPACLAVVFDITGGSVRSSVNGSTEATATLLNQDNTNFRGDHTVNFVNAGNGTGGNTNTAGNTFTGPDIKNLANGNAAVSSARFWNESGGNATGTAGVLDEVTATLTIRNWLPTAGDLTATSGNGETYLLGVWTVTGDVIAVNAALAAAEFVTGAGTTDPTLIDVAIDDGDEDGGGPTTGIIYVAAAAPDPIYVDDDFSGNGGELILDADGGTPISPATFGFDAFATLADALAAVQPTGTIIVNDGDYSTENIVLADSVTLQLTDTAGPVQVGSLGAAATNSVDLSSNTLEAGATAVAGPGIDAVISGSGNFTKVGAALLVVRGTNTYTGTTTVNDGMLRVGQVAGVIQGELAGDGPVEVNAPGRIEFNVDLDQTISQTGAISGTGSVGTLGDGTLIFDGPANTFSGGFELGDGSTSSFDGVDTGAKHGFVVLNHSDHLGTGLVLSRGSQLRAGTPGLVIPNDVDITGGGFRCGGTVDFELSGTLTPIDGALRGFGNYGLEGCDLTISGNINLPSVAESMNFEGVNNKDNGTWTVTGDITGLGNVTVQNAFDDGVVTLSGTNTYAGATIFQTGSTLLDGTHTGGANYTVQGNATFGGSGATDSAVTVNGTLSPGTNGPGILTTGDLIFTGTLDADLNTLTPGTGHDQIQVNGTVDLTGATLAVSAGAGLTPGTLLLIANNDGGDAVTGTFAGLGEGAAVDAGLLGWNGTATYLAGGGDNNDFAINFTGYTVIGQWRADNYGDPANAGAGENSAVGPNGRSNLENFALGFDADGTGDVGPLTIDVGASTITTLGGPNIWVDPADGRFYFQFTRRTDFAAAGLTITDEFSRDLALWEVDPLSVEAVVATGTGDDGVAIEALRVELPGTLPSGGKARNGRLVISISP